MDLYGFIVYWYHPYWRHISQKYTIGIIYGIPVYQYGFIIYNIYHPYLKKNPLTLERCRAATVKSFSHMGPWEGGRSQPGTLKG
jgi:hypothetical protein